MCSIIMVASACWGQSDTVTVAEEVPVSPNMLINAVNTFWSKMMDQVEEHLIQSSLPSTSITFRIEVGHSGASNTFERRITANSTKSIWQQLWEISIEIIPQVVHDIVCSTEFRTQKIIERQP